MNLQSYKFALIAVVLVLALFVASPAIQTVLVYPSAQSSYFTELWLLGPEKKAENYPYTISLNENYTVYMGLANQLGSCAYYRVEVKFCNSTQEGPSSFNRTFSSQPSLYSMNLVVPNEGNLEIPITFSFNYSLRDTFFNLDFDKITLNGMPLSLQGYSSTWTEQKRGFYGDLFFELWIYNSTTNAFQYHNRYVGLQLNMGE